MEERTLADLPEHDRADAERFIASHGGAIALRVIDGEQGELLGLYAQRYMLAYRKSRGCLPPYDLVWIAE